MRRRYRDDAHPVRPAAGVKTLLPPPSPMCRVRFCWCAVAVAVAAAVAAAATAAIIAVAVAVAVGIVERGGECSRHCQACPQTSRHGSPRPPPLPRPRTSWKTSPAAMCSSPRETAPKNSASVMLDAPGDAGRRERSTMISPAARLGFGS
eukprot:57538-Chlamydomonas_euryale.AAC.2